MTASICTKLFTIDRNNMNYHSSNIWENFACEVNVDRYLWDGNTYTYPQISKRFYQHTSVISIYLYAVTMQKMYRMQSKQSKYAYLYALDPECILLFA